MKYLKDIIIMFKMTETQNPKLNTETISSIRLRFERNKSTPEDISTLDYFIASVLGIKGFIFNKLKEEKIFNYEDFISEREKTTPERDHLINIDLYGHIMAAISYLEDYIKKLDIKQ
jgi:hypothetical protein